MTSSFEGIPCVVFEAMAMGLPIVAPDLPAIGELLGEAGDAVIAPRDSVDGYAAALAHLAGDRAHVEAQGALMRDRAKSQFTVKQMAEGHAELYEELAAKYPTRADREQPESPKGERIDFSARPKSGTPLVSVLVPHYNQARFLAECIDSVHAQGYPEIEIVVIDDASTEQGTDAVLSRLEADGDVIVVRLEDNGGPSRARNIGLERCSGRFILPVDSDNLLLPDAVEKLVEQLLAAGDDVGFIYPNIQYFGNREDYYEVPAYNVYTLLHGNFCDTCSLIDRGIFDAGERYREEIHLGHEDWEFVLRLSARGVRGEGADGPTVLYRKWGFNRSDLVDHAGERFDEVLAEISPFKGREAEIKAAESPALSLIPLAHPEAGSEAARHLAAAHAAQTCRDSELIDATDLHEALSQARGSYVAIASGTGAALLDDPTFCEKALRRFVATESEIDAIALTDAGAAGRFPFRALLPDESGGDAVAHTVIWRRTAELELPRGLLADRGDPAGSIARLLSGAGLQVAWRHMPGEEGTVRADGAWEPMPANPLTAEDPQNLRPGAKPLLPGAGRYTVPRWEDLPTWVPALSTIVVRYRESHGPGRLVTSGPPPVGFNLEHHLGVLRATSLQGTTRLVRVGDEYTATPRGGWTALPDEDAEAIGYAELAGFPQMDSLALAVHRETGQQIVVSLTPEDPILNEVDVVEHIGFVESFPPRPRRILDATRPVGLTWFDPGYGQPGTAPSLRNRQGATGRAAVGAGRTSRVGATGGDWCLDRRRLPAHRRAPASVAVPIELLRRRPLDC